MYKIKAYAYTSPGSMQICGSGPFFFGSGSADSVFQIRIRIRVTLKGRIRPDPDPDPGDPKRPDQTRSGSYLDMFLMFSKIIILLCLFLTISELQIKDKKLFGRNFFLEHFIWRENLNFRFFLWKKDPDPDSDPGDPKRPDPTGSGSATLVLWIASLRTVHKFLKVEHVLSTSWLGRRSSYCTDFCLARSFANRLVFSLTRHVWNVAQSNFLSILLIL